MSDPKRYKGFNVKIKHFLRQDGVVEVFSDHSGYWRSGHWQESTMPEVSVLRVLLGNHMTEEEIDELTDGDGHWFLPGNPP